MKATATDKASAARAAGVAKLGKRLDKDAGEYERKVLGRGLAGWRVAHTDGSAAILVRDETAPAPDKPGGHPFWKWVESPAYDVTAAPEAATLPAAIRFIVAASKGQHSAREAVPVAWSVVAGRLTLQYAQPGCDCEEAIAVVPLASDPGEARGCVAAGYLAPLFEGVHVDGWTWSAGAVGGQRVIELAADGFRVLVCELKDK